MEAVVLLWHLFILVPGEPPRVMHSQTIVQEFGNKGSCKNAVKQLNLMLQGDDMPPMMVRWDCVPKSVAELEPVPRPQQQPKLKPSSSSKRVQL